MNFGGYFSIFFPFLDVVVCRDPYASEFAKFTHGLGKMKYVIKNIVMLFHKQ